MLQYILNSNYREAHRFVTSLAFLSSQNSFQNADFVKIRSKINSQVNLKDAQFLRQCFEALQPSKIKPRHLIRKLAFIHLLLQTGKLKNQQMLTQINKQINAIIENSKKYSQKIDQIEQNQQKRSRSVANHLTNNSNSYNYTQQAQFQQNGNKNSSTSTDNSDKKHQYLSQNQVLCEKLVKPYCCFLLKKSAWQNESNLNKSTTDYHLFIWHQINILKLVFQITGNYYTMIRYYDKKFLNLIIKMTELLDQQIQRSYPNIVGIVKTLLQTKIMNCKTKNIEKIKQNFYQKRLNAEQIIQLNQIKQILSQIAQFNDKIIFTYRNKYIVWQLCKMGVKMPELMNLETVQCQLLLQKIKKQQKQDQSLLKKSLSLKKNKLKLQSQNYLKNNNTLMVNYNYNNIQTSKAQIQKYKKLTPSRLPKIQTVMKKSFKLKQNMP